MTTEEISSGGNQGKDKGNSIQREELESINESQSSGEGMSWATNQFQSTGQGKIIVVSAGATLDFLSSRG